MVEEAYEFEQQPGANIFGASPPTTGIVYVLSNVAMPGYIKIGYTSGNSSKDVEDRMRQLDSTGVPRSFDCEYAALVSNCSQVEKAIHTAFGDFRVRQNREFFEGVEPFRVKAILQLLAIEEVTPNGHRYLQDRVRIQGYGKRTANKAAGELYFSMVDLPKGSTLEWGDDPEIKCQVANDSTGVMFDGEYYSLTGLALQAQAVEAHSQRRQVLALPGRNPAPTPRPPGAGCAGPGRLLSAGSPLPLSKH